MTTRADQLIQLAETLEENRFHLSVPERELLQKVTDDKDTDDSADDDALKNPANAVEGDQSRKLRASLIAWFYIILGWMLTSLLVAGFTGLVRRVGGNIGLVS